MIYFLLPMAYTNEKNSILESSQRIQYMFLASN